MKRCSLLILGTIMIASLHAQQFIPLWPVGKMPNSKGLVLKDSIADERVYQVGIPGMYAFFPSQYDNNKSAVVIFPGGGYTHIAYGQSGVQIAKWFNTLGISAFVVNYRLPNSPDLLQKQDGPLQDAERAVKLIRQNAAAWHIDKNKIGVMGTSAGAHLAAMVGTEIKDAVSIKDDLDTVSFVPDLMILISPVIDMGKFAHEGSRVALLGAHPSPEMISRFSPQNNVTAATPACFIADAFNDEVVHPQNSLLFYQALLNKKISTSFHVFPQGGHAINIDNNPGSTEMWKPLCEMWLREMGFLHSP